MTEEIQALNAQMPTFQQISKEKQEARDQEQPKVDALDVELKALEAMVKEFEEKINAIKQELGKDR